MNDEQLNPDGLDALLRQAMKDRAEPAISFDLAAAAIANAARFAEAPAVTPTLAALSRANRWNRVFTAIAAVIIVAVSVFIFHSRLAAGGFQAWSDTTDSTTDDTTVASTATSTVIDGATTTTNQWMFIGIATAIGAVVVITAQRSLSAADEWAAAWGKAVPA